MSKKTIKEELKEWSWAPVGYAEHDKFVPLKKVRQLIRRARRGDK